MSDQPPTTIQLIRELTSPRVMQAILVLFFSIVVCYLALNSRDIPELVGFALSAIVGYFFADRPQEGRSGEPPTNTPFRPSPPDLPPSDSAEPPVSETIANALDEWRVVGDSLLVPADSFVSGEWS